jgi:hypothetical protein
LSSWAAPAPWLEPSSAAGEIKVLDRPDLAQRYAAAQAASDEYLRRYIKYWSEEVPGMLTVQSDPNEKWESFSTKMPSSAQKVNAAIQDLLKTADAALTRVDPFAAQVRSELTAASNRIHGDVAEASQGPLGEAAGNLIRTWSDRDPLVVREAILKTEPSRFISTYTIPDASGAAARYWNGLSQARLALLASTWQQMCKLVFDDKIRPFGAFPLDNATDRLPLSEARFRDAASKIAEYVKAARPSADPRTIGGGASLTDLPGKDALELLRGYYVPPEDPQWFNKTKLIIDALSVADGKCSIFVLNRARRQQLLAGSTPMDGFWSDVRLRLPDGKEQAARVGAEDADVKIADCPLHGELRMDFNRMPTAPVDPQAGKTFAAPWGVLQLINTASRAQRVQTDPRRWEVEVTLGDGLQKRSLWLLVVFDKELPDRANWPHLRSR